jgi:hypothetical protein
MGSEKLSGYGKHYQHCHAPIDNRVLEQLKKYDSPKLSVAWSKLTNYDEYINFQNWIC